MNQNIREALNICANSTFAMVKVNFGFIYSAPLSMPNNGCVMYAFYLDALINEYIDVEKLLMLASSENLCIKMLK